MHSLDVAEVFIYFGENEQNMFHHFLYLVLLKKIFFRISPDNIQVNLVLHFFILEICLPWTLYVPQKCKLKNEFWKIECLYFLKFFFDFNWQFFGLKLKL